MLRLLGYTLLLSVMFSLFVTAAVYGAQRSEQDSCVTISGGPEGLLIYDAFRGNFAAETRYREPISYWVGESEYSITLYPDLREGNRYRLVLEPHEAGESILLEEAVYQTSQIWLGSRAMWLPEQEQIAYLWQDADRQEYLTVFDMQDRSKRTAALPHFSGRNSSTRFVGRSADGRYLTLVDYDNGPGNQFLFSVEAMTLLTNGAEFPAIAAGAWSPQGAVFAATPWMATSERELLLITPDDLPEFVRISLPDEFVQTGVWSPDGERIAIASLSRMGAAGRFTTRWQFDLFTRDGVPIQHGIEGTRMQSIPFSNSQTFYTNFVPGFWSVDGQAWLFLREQSGDNGLADLVSLKVETGEETVVERGIVAALLPLMFYRSASAAFAFSSGAAVPDGTHMILPLQRVDGLTLEYMDFEQNQRLTLLEGARNVLPSALQSSILVWGLNRSSFVVPYAGAAGNAHLRIVREDGSVLADVGGMDEISGVRPTAQGLSFLGLRDGKYGIETIDAETGAHQRLMSGLTEDIYWDMLMSPDEAHAAYVLRPNQSDPSYTRGHLALVSMSDGEARELYEDVLAYPEWSPDGSILIHFYSMANARLGLRVLNADGTVLRQSPLPRRITSRRYIYAWSRCEVNPRP